MSLLSLILIAMALIVGACVFYVAWELSSDKLDSRQESVAEQKKGPDESKESKDPPSP